MEYRQRNPATADRCVVNALLHCVGVAVLLLLLPQSFCIATDRSSITPDDLAVFRAVLRSHCRPMQQKYYVISDLPISARDHAVPSGWSSRLPWADLAAPVPDGIRWPHKDVCAADRVVDGKKVDSIFERDAHIRSPPSWDPFYAQFPGAQGLIRMSLPAFTPDHKDAVVYMQTTCNPLCGSGFYIELVRGKKGWRISRHENAWIS